MENKKLKLYRVVNHPFMEGITGTDFPYQYESLLYLGGYSMIKKLVKGDCLSSNLYIYKIRQDYSKYFFAFPEDAINYRNYLTQTGQVNILEYEFDYDKLPKMFGIGNYNLSWYGEIGNNSNMMNIESLVSLDELGGERLELKDLSKSERLKMVRKMYVDSLNVHNYYSRLRGKPEIEIDPIDGYKSVPELVDFLLDCDHDVQMLRTSAITGNMFTTIRRKWASDEEVVEQLRQQGLILNFSEEAEQARLEIVNDLEYQRETSDEEYWEKAKQMVLDYRRRFPN